MHSAVGKRCSRVLCLLLSLLWLLVGLVSSDGVCCALNWATSLFLFLFLFCCSLRALHCSRGRMGGACVSPVALKAQEGFEFCLFLTDCICAAAAALLRWVRRQQLQKRSAIKPGNGPHTGIGY